jgi:hypothetical protein
MTERTTQLKLSLTKHELILLACVLDSCLDKGWFDNGGFEPEDNVWLRRAEFLMAKFEKHGYERVALLHDGTTR